MTLNVVGARSAFGFVDVINQQIAFDGEWIATDMPLHVLIESGFSKLVSRKRLVAATSAASEGDFTAALVHK